MKTIHMIDDYKILCEESKSIGKFAAYKAYTQKYPQFFQGVFKYLYCQPIENLKPMIEQTNFQKLLQAAENNYEAGIVDYAIDSVNKFINMMEVNFEFTFLLGQELSNIDGCAGLGATDEPQLYIGIDKSLSKDRLDMLIPHELLHIARSHLEKTKISDCETVFSRTIEEGLATYAPLWVHNMEWNIGNVAKTLDVSEKQVNNLMSQTDVLLEKLVFDGDKAISSETMKEYFTTQTLDQEYPLVGYYVGLYLAHTSVKKGVEFKQISFMTTNDIKRIWFPESIWV